MSAFLTFAGTRDTKGRAYDVGYASDIRWNPLHSTSSYRWAWIRAGCSLCLSRSSSAHDRRIVDSKTLGKIHVPAVLSDRKRVREDDPVPAGELRSEVDRLSQSRMDRTLCARRYLRCTRSRFGDDQCSRKRPQTFRRYCRCQVKVGISHSSSFLYSPFKI